MPESFTNYTFTEDEHPTSLKWNAILGAMERARLNNGPIKLIDVTNASNTAYLRYLEVDEDNIYDICDGVTINRAYNRPSSKRMFTVYYMESGNEPDHHNFILWKNVIITSGKIGDGFSGASYPCFVRLLNTPWYTDYNEVISGEAGTGPTNLNLLTASSYNFYMIPQSYAITGVGW